MLELMSLPTLFSTLKMLNEKLYKFRVLLKTNPLHNFWLKTYKVYYGGI
jgi:hypothetical protein